MNMEWLPISIAILYIYNLVFDSISLFKFGKTVNDKQQEKSALETRENHRITDVIVFALSILLSLSLIVFFIWADIFPKNIVIPLIAIPTWGFHINNLVKASESVKSVVFGNDSNHNLSVKEKCNFDIISGIVLLFYSNFMPGKAEQYIIELSISRTVTGILLDIYSALIIFGLTFSIIIQLILPIKHLHKICKCISNKSKIIVKKLSSTLYYKHYEDTIVKARFTNCITDSVSHRNVLIRSIIYVLILPFSFLIDVIIGFFLCIFWYGICGITIIVYEFLSFLGKVFFYLISIVFNSPERRIIKNSFRLSFIISILFVVIMNRYAWIYEYDEVFLAVTEFLASTIIIPVIFEWIYSSDKNATNTQIQSQLPAQTDSSNNNQKNKNQKKTNRKNRRKRKKQ